jgi:biotin carboxyl carrier protein
MVPEAEAIMGVRRRTARRTAVVVGSAAASETAAAQQQTAQAQQEAAAANQRAAAAEQEAAAAQQQAAAAQQQAAAQPASAVPVGTVVQQLPAGCVNVTVGNTSYSDCGGVFYRSAFQGNTLVYVVVEKPL